jgi:hypothetical protein
LVNILTAEFGKGLDRSNLNNMRQFYLVYPICDAVSHKLSWTYYRRLICIEDEHARNWYKKEPGQLTNKTLKKLTLCTSLVQPNAKVFVRICGQRAGLCYTHSIALIKPICFYQVVAIHVDTATKPKTFLCPRPISP